MSLLAANKVILDSVIDFLKQVTEVDYRQPLAVFNGSSLGEHTRHIIEFYQCLIAHSAIGMVNYDLRLRNRELQEEPVKAIEALHEVLEALAVLPLDRVITLEVNPYTQQGVVQQVPTIVERELLYVFDHAIHHMALIKIGVHTALPDNHLPADFGVAPSTLRSRVGHSAA